MMATGDDKGRFRQTYENWIRANGNPVTTQPNPNVFSESIYTHPNRVSVSIRQLNDESDRIILAANLAFPSDAQQLIAALPNSEQGELTNEVALMLTQMGVQFNFQSQNNILQSIGVERTVFGEGMTKQIFFDNLYRIIDALAALQTQFRQRLGTGAGRVTEGGSSTNTSFYG